MRHPRLTLGIVLAVVCTCVQAGPSPTPDTVVSAFYTWAMRPMSHVVPDRVADVFAADARSRSGHVSADYAAILTSS